MLTFFGTGVICLGLVVAHLAQRGWTSGALIMAASLIYLAGCLGVTLVFNVPLNHALAVVPAHAPDGVSFWSRFLKVWTSWNHVRTAAAIVAALLLTLAFRDTSFPG
jgi:uncharacterized membrane protein